MSLTARHRITHHRLSRLFGAFAALCLVLTALTMQTAQAAGTGSITGKILTQTPDNQPVAAAGVGLDLEFSATERGNFEGIPGVVSSDATGTYTFSGLADGFYHVRAYTPGFATEYYGDAWLSYNAETIEVSAGNAKRLGLIVLEHPGQVSGTVTDENDAAVPGAKVTISETNQTSGRGGGGFVITAAQDGTFDTATDLSTADIPPGDDYTISAQPATQVITQRPYFVKDVSVTIAADVTRAHDIKLVPRPSALLTAVGPDSQPLGNIELTVKVRDQSGTWGLIRSGPNNTDGLGRYRLYGGDEDTAYKVRFNVPASPSILSEWYADASSEATATIIDVSDPDSDQHLTARLNARGVLTTKKVSVTGTRKVGKKLRADTHSWGPKPVKLSYKWYRNGHSISGQKGRYYKLRNGDKGKRISVRVYQSKASYTTASRVSARTGTIKKK